jgi:hypothetical protein
MNLVSGARLAAQEAPQVKLRPLPRSTRVAGCGCARLAGLGSPFGVPSLAGCGSVAVEPALNAETRYRRDQRSADQDRQRGWSSKPLLS